MGIKSATIFCRGITEQLVDGDFIDRIAIQTIFAGNLLLHYVYHGHLDFHSRVTIFISDSTRRYFIYYGTVSHRNESK